MQALRAQTTLLDLRLPNPSDLVAVERAISELRAGRAVVLRAGAAQWRLQGIEAANLNVTAEARLVLSGARLRFLGQNLPRGGGLPCAGLSLQRLQNLSLNRALIEAPTFSAASETEVAALDLAKIALTLPALIISPATHSGDDLVCDMGAIAAYRAAQTQNLHIISRAPVPLEGASSEFVVFRGGEGLRDQVAIIIGQPDFSASVTVRLHSACLTGDLFGSLKCDCGDQLRETAKAMAAGKGGIILYLDQEGRGTGIGNKMRAYALQAEGLDTFDADEVLGFEHDERHFGFAARMLQLLGAARIELMTNNPAKVAALVAAGLQVTATLAIQGRQTAQNRGYLETKRDRGGHMLDIEVVGD